jgi:hypothetical protein
VHESAQMVVKSMRNHPTWTVYLKDDPSSQEQIGAELHSATP